MQGETEQHWRKLCEQAVVEQDPNELIRLVEEINRVLGDKEERLLREQQGTKKQSTA